MKRLTAVLSIILFLFLSACSFAGDDVAQKNDGKVIIALLDTGVSTSAIKKADVLPGWNYVTDTDDTEDRINHGTAVTSVILGSESAKIDGVATNTCVVPLVVADKISGEIKSVSPEILGKAIRDSIDKYGASVINVSLGTKKDSSELRSAVEYVQQKGALVVAAAGNSGDENLYFPAAYEGVLTVGSHDKHNKISSFTQQNDTLDILAPGEDIWLASRNGKTYGARGTSYATGYVSAVAALVLQDNPDKSAEDVKKQILDNSEVTDGYKILNLKLNK